MVEFDHFRNTAVVTHVLTTVSKREAFKRKNEDVEMARLEEFCVLNMGQSPDSSSYNKSGEGLPFFQGNADFGKIHPTARVWCSSPTKVAHKGDVLISVRAPIGALNIADGKCCIGRGLAALTVNESLCIKDYLWYAITSKVDELNSKGTGSTFKAISKAVLAETEIPLPNLNEQKKVSERLAIVDNLISLRKEQLKKLDQLVKSREDGRTANSELEVAA